MSKWAMKKDDKGISKVRWDIINKRNVERWQEEEKCLVRWLAMTPDSSSCVVYGNEVMGRQNRVNIDREAGMYIYRDKRTVCIWWGLKGWG